MKKISDNKKRMPKTGSILNYSMIVSRFYQTRTKLKIKNLGRVVYNPGEAFIPSMCPNRFYCFRMLRHFSGSTFVVTAY